MSVKGEANVSWERTRTTKDSQGRSHTHVDHFRASEQYFNLTYYLLGNTGNFIKYYIYKTQLQEKFTITCMTEYSDKQLNLINC